MLLLLPNVDDDATLAIPQLVTGVVVVAVELGDVGVVVVVVMVVVVVVVVAVVSVSMELDADAEVVGVSACRDSLCRRSAKSI